MIQIAWSSCFILTEIQFACRPEDFKAAEWTADDTQDTPQTDSQPFQSASWSPDPEAIPVPANEPKAAAKPRPSGAHIAVNASPPAFRETSQRDRAHSVASGGNGFSGGGGDMPGGGKGIPGGGGEAQRRGRGPSIAANGIELSARVGEAEQGGRGQGSMGGGSRKEIGEAGRGLQSPDQRGHVRGVEGASPTPTPYNTPRDEDHAAQASSPEALAQVMLSISHFSSPD